MTLAICIYSCLVLVIILYNYVFFSTEDEFELVRNHIT